MAANEIITAIHTADELRTMALAEAKAVAAKIGTELAEGLEFDRCGNCKSEDDEVLEGEHIACHVSYDVDCDIYEDGDGYYTPRTEYYENVRGGLNLISMYYYIDEDDYYEHYDLTEEERDEIEKLIDQEFQASFCLLEG